MKTGIKILTLLLFFTVGHSQTLELFKETHILDFEITQAIELEEFIISKSLENTVIIDFMLLNEININEISVEKSKDGKRFDIIRSVESKGNGSLYSLNDEDPFVGKNYYRLRTMNFNGEINFSDIKVINIDIRDFETSIYPMPAIHKTFSIKTKAEGNYSILNSIGQEIKRGQLNQDTETNIQLDQDTPAGWYLVRIESLNTCYPLLID